MEHEFDEQKATQVISQPRSGDMTEERAQKIADILCEIFNRYSGLDCDIKLVKTE